MLLNGLPPEAAIHRIDGRQWTDVHELLATAVEVIDRWGRLTAAPHYKGDLQDGEPLQIARPWAPDPAPAEQSNRMVTDRREIARWFGGVGK